jgi:hypothetical protein
MPGRILALGSDAVGTGVGLAEYIRSVGSKWSGRAGTRDQREDKRRWFQERRKEGRGEEGSMGRTQVSLLFAQ